MSKPLLWIILSILLGSGLIFQLVSRPTQLKTAYVSNAKLSAEFLLSKALDAKLKNVQLTRQGILDSLALQLNALEAEVATQRASDQVRATFGRLQNEYRLKQQQFAEDNALLTQRYQEQIATQLNQYLKDFTAAEEYDYIFGATSAGSLMGAKEGYDVTDAGLRYANARYKGAAQ